MNDEDLYEYLTNTNNAAVHKYGRINQLFVCIEELSELQHEITRAGRGRVNRPHLYEEFADAFICMMMVAQIFKLDENEIVKEIERKLDRTNRRMANEEL